MNPTEQTMDSNVEAGPLDSPSGDEGHPKLKDSQPREHADSSSSSEEEYIGRTQGSAENGEHVSNSERVLNLFRPKKKKNNRKQPKPLARARTSTSMSDSQYAASVVQSLSPGRESEKSTNAPEGRVWSFEESVVPSNLGSGHGSNDSGIADFPGLQNPSVTEQNLTRSPEMYIASSRPSSIDLSEGVDPVASSGGQLQPKNLRPVSARSHPQADEGQPTTGLGIKGSTLDRHVD